MRKRIFSFISSLTLLLCPSAQATIYLSDNPHLASLKSRADAIFPGSVTHQIWSSCIEFECLTIPPVLIDTIQLNRLKVFAVCNGSFGNGYFGAEYQSGPTRSGNFRRLYRLSYNRQIDQFSSFNSSDYYSFYPSLPLSNEFYQSYFSTFGAPGGLYCLGFNLLVDYFDQSNFQSRSSFLPILPFSRPKSGCYAMATLPGFSSNSNTNTGLKPEVYNTSSSFVSGLRFLAPDNSEVTSELIYETQNNYDKAYFSAQWVNPQCKWIPSHFRHKTNSWSDISNFFSSLFF